MKIGLAQTNTGIDPAENARGLTQAIADLATRGAEAVFLPEMCGLLDRDGARLRSAVQSEEQDIVLRALRESAARHALFVLVGSLAVLDPAKNRDGRLANRSFVLGRNGDILARYDKMHLFDVQLGDGDRYRESARYAPGDEAVVANIDAVRVGLTICYDLRFPEMHAALAQQGAQILAQPSSFTVPTGRAHWHVLLRARAIETGAFVVAAAQTGLHQDGRATYGHSLVVGPWGDVLLDMGEEPGTALAEIDLAEVAKARARMPALGARGAAPPVAIAGHEAATATENAGRPA